MKDSTQNVIVVIVIILIIGSLTTLVIMSVNSDIKKHNEVCIKIGDANMQFLFQSSGKCGFGVDCQYQCRFLNSNGEQIIKNVK